MSTLGLNNTACRLPKRAGLTWYDHTMLFSLAVLSVLFALGLAVAGFGERIYNAVASAVKWRWWRGSG